MVIRVDGMELMVQDGNWVNRTGVAEQIRKALLSTAGPTDGLKVAILDVVCSNTRAEGWTQAAGLQKVSSTFYVRFPAFLGYVALGQWDA